MISVDPFTLHVITGAVLPIILGFVFRQGWTARVKQMITMVVSTVSSFLLQAVNDDGYAVFSLRSVAMAIVQLVIAIATYMGFYHNAIDPNRNLPAVPVPQSVDDKFRKAE